MNDILFGFGGALAILVLGSIAMGLVAYSLRER